MTVMWTVVIPVKVLARAKSRLGILAGARRPELALAMAADTVSVVLDCPEVAQVIVVTSDEAVRSVLSPFGVTVVGDEPEGLNAALVHGASVALRRWPGTGIAALSADLPALRPAELERALRAAAALPGGASGQAAFVADEQGVGTTLYAAREGVEFRPAFGGESRRRHAAAGVCELLLDGIPGLRRDVDTPADLRTAVALGTGPRTMAVAGDLLRV
jgi:2-phospho-L-lactate/phosphoenolpyruvate guanylyltransferase